MSKVAQVELFGGIGNQLFQYAAGRYLEEEYGKICTYSGWRTGYRVSLPFLERTSSADIFAKPAKLIERLLSKYPILRKIEIRLASIYESEKVGWDPSLEMALSCKRFRGYFQSYRYANSITALDKKIILNLERPSIWFQNCSLEMQRIGSVAIHIRRGDYLQNPDFGTLHLSYYHEALAEIEKAMKIENVWIFSDEVSAAEEFRRSYSGNAHLVNQDSTSTDYESLILMSRARAIVIANSTYSWWAAFLADQGTHVIAPDKWFKNLEDPNYLIPDNWQQINSIWEAKAHV